MYIFLYVRLQILNLYFNVFVVMVLLRLDFNDFDLWYRDL